MAGAGAFGWAVSNTAIFEGGIREALPPGRFVLDRFHHHIKMERPFKRTCMYTYAHTCTHALVSPRLQRERTHTRASPLQVGK